MPRGRAYNYPMNFVGWFRPLGSPRWYQVAAGESEAICREGLSRYKAGYIRASRVVLPKGINPSGQVAPPGRSPSMDC